MQEKLNEITKFFFTVQHINKLYHWNTLSYSRHKASDEFNEKLLEIIDRFIEVFIGRYNLKPRVSKIQLDNLSDEDIIEFYKRGRDYIQTFDQSFKDTELLNIRDELLAEINQTLYLFNLR